MRFEAEVSVVIKSEGVNQEMINLINRVSGLLKQKNIEIPTEYSDDFKSQVAKILSELNITTYSAEMVAREIINQITN